MPIVQLGDPNLLFQNTVVTRSADSLVQGPSPDQLTAAPAAGDLLEAVHSGFFYPRFVFAGGTELDFTTQAAVVVVSEAAVRAENVSWTGFQETLYMRLESRLSLSFSILTRSTLDAVRGWWKDWACYGRQTAIILDRYNTCGGQYEYDYFNTFFDRGHCLTNPFEPHRLVPGKQYYTLQLLFRQGMDESLVL